MIATDLDGTLVHDRQIAPIDRSALLKVLEKGIPVMPATTRMRFSSSQICSELPIFDQPLVCLNGARVVGPGWDDHEGHENWFEKRFDIEAARSISRYADERGYELTTVFNERKYRKRRAEQRMRPDGIDRVAYLVERNQDAVADGTPPVSFMMHKEENGRSGLEDIESYAIDELSTDIVVHRHHRMGEWVALTLYPKGTSKLDALKIACEKMDISLENVMTIGDDEVDEDMLEVAGLGVAMGNSPSYIKKIADDVAPSCTEGGFAWIMKKYFL